MGDVGAAGIGAQSHGDVVFQTCPGHGDHTLQHHLAVLLLLVGGMGDAAVKQRIGDGGGEGSHLKRAALPEQAQDLLIRLGAVLDGVHAVLQRHPDTLRAFHVGSHLHAQPVGFIAGGLHQRRLHPQNARLAHHLGVHHAAGDHQLDEVGLFRRDPLHVGRCLLRRPCLIGQRAGHVAARYGYRHIGGHHPGAEDLACRRLLADDGVKVRHAAHGTDGGNAAEQLRSGVALAELDTHPAHKAVGGDELHQLFRVGGLFLRLTGGRQVYVQVDQSRQDVPSRQIHRLIPGRYRAVGDGGDLAALHTDDLAGLGGHVPRSVQQNAVYQRIARLVFVHRSTSCKKSSEFL